MQRKITLISELNDVLNNGIVCLVHENHVKKDNPFYEFGYLTGSINYIRQETKEPELNVESERTVYDLMSNKLLETPAYQGFYGEIFHIANLGAPKYFDYFAKLLSDEYLVDFEQPLFHSDGREVFLESVSEENENLVFSVRIRDGFAGVVQVDRKGLDKNNNVVVSNFKLDEIKKLFQDDEGYLIIGEESGPIFLSKEAYNRFLNSKLSAESIGLNGGERYKMHPVLNVLYQDEIVDTLLLNNPLQDNKLTQERLVFTELFRDKSEEIEYETFETNSDAWDQSFDEEDKHESNAENVFLKSAEEMLGAPITFEADYSEPDSWGEDYDDIVDDSDTTESVDWEESLFDDIEDDIINQNKNNDSDEWDDEIDLDEED